MCWQSCPLHGYANTLVVSTKVAAIHSDAPQWQGFCLYKDRQGRYHRKTSLLCSGSKGKQSLCNHRHMTHQTYFLQDDNSLAALILLKVTMTTSHEVARLLVCLLFYPKETPKTLKLVEEASKIGLLYLCFIHANHNVNPN